MLEPVREEVRSAWWLAVRRGVLRGLVAEEVVAGNVHGGSAQEDIRVDGVEESASDVAQCGSRCNGVHPIRFKESALRVCWKVGVQMPLHQDGILAVAREVMKDVGGC